MRKGAAIIGAGVSGLTCCVVFAEHTWDVTIFADETGEQTTSGVAAALWFPYDAEPVDKIIPWSLITYERLRELTRDSRSGVSMLQLRQFTRASEIAIPNWAKKNLGAHSISVIPSENASPARTEGSLTIPGFPSTFTAGFALTVPRMDATIYLDYLAKRFRTAGGTIQSAHISKVDEIPRDFDVIINCAGIGARELVHDSDLEAHRGRVAIVPKIDLAQAIICNDAPLMYAIRARTTAFSEAPIRSAKIASPHPPTPPRSFPNAAASSGSSRRR